jgi:hypothetical protein
MMGMFEIIHHIKAPSCTQAILKAFIFYHVVEWFSIGGSTTSVKFGGYGAIDSR